MPEIALLADTVTTAFAAGSNSVRSLTLRNNSSVDIYYSPRPDVSHDTAGTKGMLLKPTEVINYKREQADLSQALYAIATDAATLLVEPFRG